MAAEQVGDGVLCEAKTVVHPESVRRRALGVVERDLLADPRQQRLEALGEPVAWLGNPISLLLLPALEVYRARFQPSAQLREPYVMVAVNVIAAEDDPTGERLFTSAQQAFTNIIRGTRGQLPPPVDDIEAHWSPAEKAHVSNMLSRSYVGSPDTVREGLESLIAETEADELIVAAAIHDHSARVHSYEILATVQQALSAVSA